MNIGQSIKNLRKAKGINQATFAESVGITQTYLSQIENGHKEPSTYVLRLIAEEIEMPLPILFWFSVEETDILPRKKQAFKTLKPAVDALLKEFFIDTTKTKNN